MQKCLQTMLKLETCNTYFIRYEYQIYFNDKILNILFYAAVHSMMMGHSSPQHVRFDVLKRYCGSAELCAFVCLHFSNRIIMREIKNIKYRLGINKVK